MATAEPYVFISYSRDDQGYVDRLASLLREHGINCWTDRHMDYGDRWPIVVRDRIDGCAAFVVVMTPAAEESEWVDRELHRAELKQKSIFPLLLQGDPFFRLGVTQHENVGDGVMPSAAFIERVSRAVSGSSAPVPLPAQGATVPAALGPIIGPGAASVHVGKPALYRTFWAQYLERVRVAHPGWTRARIAPPDNWLAMPSPFSGGPTFVVSFARGTRLRHELYIDYGVASANASLFDALFARRTTIEANYGAPLSWEALPGKRASRIADYRDGDVARRYEFDEYIGWFIHCGERMRAAFALNMPEPI